MWSYKVGSQVALSPVGGDSSFRRRSSLSWLGSVERRGPEGADVRLRIWREAAAHLARHAEPWRSLPMRKAKVGITQRLLSRSTSMRRPLLRRQIGRAETRLDAKSRSGFEPVLSEGGVKRRSTQYTSGTVQPLCVAGPRTHERRGVSGRWAR